MLKILFAIILYGFALSNSFSQIKLTTKENGKSPYLNRSTLGSNGLSKTVTAGKNSYHVTQSIGQASVIGTFSNKNYTIRQGFQQPLISIGNAKLLDENTLKGKLYPNPFHQSVNVLFEEIFTTKLKVVIYNLSGSVLHSVSYSPSQMINIPLDFLPKGDYLIKMIAQNKQLTSKIIKH